GLMDVRIIGTDLPGRTWSCYEDVHVGVQERQMAVDLVPGDASRAVWDFPVKVVAADGGIDFRGPHVDGKRGERFVYLSWGTVHADGRFEMFRRAKLMLAAVGAATVDAANQPGRRLVGTMRLSAPDGSPRCAALRPPGITWAAEESA